jgi:hypothetical protein
MEAFDILHRRTIPICVPPVLGLVALHSSVNKGEICELESWRKSNRYIDWDSLAVIASKAGHKEVLVWIAEDMLDLFTRYAGPIGAIDSLLESISQKKNMLHLFNIMSLADAEGQLEAFKWLRGHTHANGVIWNLLGQPSVFNAAASNGHLDLVKWLHLHGGRWDSWTCTEAAVGGHLHVLTWLRQVGCPWDTVTAAAGAYSMNSAVINFLRAEKCPCDRLVADVGYLVGRRWAEDEGVTDFTIIANILNNCAPHT